MTGRDGMWLALCAAGAVAPYACFIPWVAENGLNPARFAADAFATPIAAMFTVDVIVAAIALWAVLFTEGRARLGRAVWWPALATLLVGVSLGLPLYMYLRGRARRGAGGAA